jgi:hypothetical protein
MQITLDKKTKSKVKAISKKTGVPEKELINRSVSAYISEVQNAIKLKKELDGWDFLSALSMSKNKF